MKVRIGSMEIEVFDGVYPPSEDTYMLMDAVKQQGGRVALELCPGTGAVGLSVAHAVGLIVAVDISPDAARNTLHNYRANGAAPKLEAVVGDLFSPLGDREFDLILMNPPYLPDDGGLAEDGAWSAGSDGRAVIDRFILEVGRHLAAGGKAFFLQSTVNGVEESLEALRGQGLLARIVLTADFQFEGLVIIEAVRPSPKS